MTPATIEIKAQCCSSMIFTGGAPFLSTWLCRSPARAHVGGVEVEEAVEQPRLF
jgi:hypothetical protein